MGFGFAPFNRLNTATYLDVDLGPGIQGAFLVSLLTPPFDLPPLLGIQVPIPSVFEMNLAPQELSLENVRNLSVALIGVNQSPELFDRISVVNTTVVYVVPELPVKNIPALSTWMMVLLGAMLLGAGVVFRRSYLIK